MELIQHLGQGNFYPQLFSDQIANFHSNVKYGFIFKRNFYNSLSDILEGDVSNRPVNPMLLTKKLLKSLASMKPLEILKEIQRLSDSLEKETSRIGNRLETFSQNDGSARAEFRLSFKNLASMTYLLSGAFDSETIRSSLIGLTSETVSDLGQLYLTMLSEPIFC